MAITLTGKVSGSATTHTPESLKAVFKKAYVALPLANGSLFEGTLDELKEIVSPKTIVLFIHGSSGINPATRIFANHLAQQGYAFVAPDSMQLKDRITYTSPVAREVYEQIHSLRYAELSYTVSHLKEIIDLFHFHTNKYQIEYHLIFACHSNIPVHLPIQKHQQI